MSKSSHSFLRKITDKQYICYGYNELTTMQKIQQDNQTMKIKFIGIFFFFICGVYGQAQNTFQKLYGNIAEYNNGGRFGATVLQTSDSGFIMIGINRDTLNYNAYLIKTNKLGDTLWTKIYGSINAAFKIIQTSDGGYAFCGQSQQRAILIKTNSFGDTLWTKKYITSSYSMLNSLQQTIDGGYILAGSADIAFGNSNVLLIKTDSIGQLLWSKLYGGSGLNEAFSVFEEYGSGYITSGFVPNGNFIMKTDFGGNIIWLKVYGDNNGGFGKGFCMQKTIDGGYVLCGVSYPGNNQDIYVIRIDSLGNLIWSKDYDRSPYDYGFYISQTNDNGFIIAGGTNATQGYYITYLLKTDANGDTLWTRTINDTNSLGYCVHQTFDNGYVILYSKSNGFFLIKTDSTANACFQNIAHTTVITPTTIVTNPSIPSTTPSINVTSFNSIISSRGTVFTICPPSSVNELPANTLKILIFPNPFSTQTTLQSDKFFKDVTLTAYNSFGQIVKQIKNINGQTITFNRDNLPSGLYFIRLTEENKIYTDKLVITDN